MNIEQYTNAPELYAQLQLEQYNCALWLPHQKNHILDVDFFSPDPVIEKLRSKASWTLAEKIFIIGQECIFSETLHHRSNIHVWEPMSSSNVRLHHNPFWFMFTNYANHKIHGHTKLVDPRDHPPQYYFDCLIGRTRLNKNFVGDFVINNNLTDRMLFSFYGKNTPWLPGHEYDLEKTVTNSQENIDYGNLITSPRSLFVPYMIYNDSWFSIVAETNPGSNFITEKTAKALLGRRLFIVFSGANHLKLLQDLGFKTFSNVIDESYDNETDNTKRWTKAAEQITYLLSQNPADIYEQVFPALVHNQNLIHNTDWTDVLNQSIVDCAKS